MQAVRCGPFWSAGSGRARQLPHFHDRSALELAALARLAAVAAPVLALEALLLRDRAVDLRPLAVLEDDLVAAGKDLEWPVHLAQVVELHRSRLAEGFKIGRVDEVAHGDAV